MHSILERFFGVDAQTILEKAEGPQNTLFVNISACVGFREFRWCLRPTEVRRVAYRDADVCTR